MILAAIRCSIIRRMATAPVFLLIVGPERKRSTTVMSPRVFDLTNDHLIRLTGDGWRARYTKETAGVQLCAVIAKALPLRLTRAPAALKKSVWCTSWNLRHPLHFVGCDCDPANDETVLY
jgi:hypothetical protein